MSLGSRYVRSIRWTVGLGVLQTVVLLTRSVLLARLLPPETFGIYAFAVAIVGIPALVSEFGLAEAFLHRASETEDESQAASVHFTLRIALAAAILIPFVIVACLLTSGDLRWAFLGVTAGYLLLTLGSTATLILTRRVVHRRLAARQLTSALLTTFIAVILAQRGAGIWALLATDIINGLTFVLFLMSWRPVWRPKFAWVPSVIRYYLNFGKRSVLGGLMLRGMDELDDLWTGAFLGNVALGLYSRAFQFATFPRQVLAVPFSAVVDGTYAALKGDRGRLSEAFFRTNALIIRSSFPLAGLLALTATEFIPVVLGAQWAPMIPTFRLMLLFTMLDPIRSTLASVFFAVGRPEIIGWVRVMQVLILLAGLITLGPRWNIEGVGVSVNVMLLVGIAILLRQARRFVDYSTLKLFGVPALALVLALVVAYYGAASMQFLSWWTLVAAKSAFFILVYGAVSLLFEGKELMSMARIYRRLS